MVGGIRIWIRSMAQFPPPKKKKMKRKEKSQVQLGGTYIEGGS